ncbi:MAG: HAD family hydrolase [Desulfobulbus sp.]|jgi:HAD superfamily hydrolase (TIGR01549 family)
MSDCVSSWESVFFDFDGVIAESAGVKADAFAALFAPYGPAVQESAVRYHLDNGGLPRREKLRHCFAAFAGTPADEAKLDEVGVAFFELVLDAVVEAPLVQGALETLQSLARMRTPAFVVSGTPTDELRQVVKRKGLDSFFVEVQGSPRAKPEIVAELVRRHRLRPERGLFIGDALADYRAARSAGLHFLGIVPVGTASVFPPETPCSPVVTLDIPGRFPA